MQVQINLNALFEYKAGQKVKSSDFCGDIVPAIDPGKTNMAMAVGIPFGTQLCILQLRAPGSACDTSDYYHDFKGSLTRYFAGCRFSYSGIERAISKRGMSHHHSFMVLTEIRVNLTDLACSLTGGKPLEINNWARKYAILSDGMWFQSERGSIRFLPGIYKKYGNADVANAICVYRCITEKHCGPYVIFPNRSERAPTPYKVSTVPSGSRVASTARRFQYEKGPPLVKSRIFFANRTWEKGVAAVDVDVLSLDDIYSHAIRFVPGNSGETVEVVVVRSQCQHAGSS